MQWLCTADVDVPIGRAVYTGMLNSAGGYEADVTVTRLAPTQFLVVSGAASAVRDVDWIRRKAPDGHRTEVVDVTAMYAVFGVMGPASRELLTRLSGADLTDAAFPFATSRELRLGYATARATRITYVGELGWELYVPVEFAAGVYDELFNAGHLLGAAPAGYYTIDAMRLEKGYRAFGRELVPDATPIEAGLSFTCKLASGIDFLGRSAVERVKTAGPSRRIVSIVVGDPTAEPLAGDPAAYLWGGELLLRDGEPVGQVTSAGWGHALGAPVGLAWAGSRQTGPVTPEWLRTGGYEVDVAGRRVPVTVSLRPPFDPDGVRLGRGPA